MHLPNFLIIGVAKAGTTSLYRYLSQHPQIFMCPVKETNYFAYEDAQAWIWHDEGEAPMLRSFRIKTLEAYEALFANVSTETAIGEASPQYLRCPNTPQRIHNCIPNVKIVAILRNPADRAFSGYLMRKRRGELVKNCYEELTYNSSHVKEGFYFKRLKRYFDTFSKDQIKVYFFEEFKKDPMAIMVDLFHFLEVDTTFVPDTSIRHNTAAVPKSRLLNKLFFDPELIRIAKSVLPKKMYGVAKNIRGINLNAPPRIPSDLRMDLINFYREDISKLEDLLDMDFSIWYGNTNITKAKNVY